jgi:quinol monooxygenase YgiN
MMSESIVVTAEFRLKPEAVQTWLRLMLEHHGPACVADHGMLRFWLQHDDDDPAHILLYEHWADRADFDASLQADWREAYLAETEQLWASPRIVTTYRMIDTPWEPLDSGGLPASLASAAPQRSVPTDSGRERS